MKRCGHFRLGRISRQGRPAGRGETPAPFGLVGRADGGVVGGPLPTRLWRGKDPC